MSLPDQNRWRAWLLVLWLVPRTSARWPTGGVILALLGSIAFGCKAGDGFVVEHEIDRVRASSNTTGTRLVSATSPSRGASSVQASWEIESDQEWPAYREVLERALPAGYTASASGGHDASFTRRLSGDTFYIRVEVLSAGPPLRIRLTFLALAG